MMDRLFLDTNIVIDLVGGRSPYDTDAARLMTRADRGDVEVVVTPLTIANTFYTVGRHADADRLRQALRTLRTLVHLAPMHTDVVDRALGRSAPDFEDVLQYEAAVSAGCTVLITRNARDFSFAHLPVMDARAYWSAAR